MQAVLHPEVFLQEVRRQRDFSGHRRAAYVFMISPSTGRVQSSPEARFIAIDGVISVNYHHVPGDIQQETRDLLSSPGVVIAIRDNPALLKQTIAEIRDVEGDFYHSGLMAE